MGWHFYCAGEWILDRNRNDRNLTLAERILKRERVGNFIDYLVISEYEYIVTYLHVGHSNHWKLLPVSAT